MAAQMAVIFRFSSLSDLPEMPGGLPYSFGHFLGYFLLGALALRAFAGARWKAVTAAAAVRALALSSFYGATDEAHQSFVPGRTASLEDWLVDVAGALAAVLSGLAIARTAGRKPRVPDV